MSVDNSSTELASPLVFAVPGDLHLTDAGQENYRAALWAVEEIESLIRPDLVVFIGDNAQEAKPAQFELFADLRSRLSVPSAVLVGDHDVHEDSEARGFCQYVGDTYGVHLFPGVRVLCLNTQQARPLGISREQITWLRAQVEAARGAAEQVLIFQHNYPFQIWENFEGPGIPEWREIVQTQPILAVICGHTHYFQEANDGRNVYAAVRSVGDPEGGASGYLVGFVHNDDLAFAYRTREDTGPLVMITHPRAALLAAKPHHVVSGDEAVRFFHRTASPLASARWRLDGGEWQPVEWESDGTGQGQLATAGLSKGTHSLEIEVQDANGLKGRQVQEFVFDPTGRYTPVPAVYPQVTQTKFC